MSPSEPSGADLLRLEREARRAGSGLVAGDLQGCWQLHQVWPKDGERPSSVSAALLRGLAARLEIRSSPDGLMLRNAVSLGPLELCFQGPGWLMGARPLLVFRFEVLELQLAGRTLLRRPLPAPEPRRLPFFALIARDSSGWLAARGRGGGLALWRLATAPAASAASAAAPLP